jgi:catechol 2,3-dioxygenase-like lactoylglutathione lyase family enzyme
VAKILRIDHVAIAVRDVDASVATWQTVLGAELVARERLTLQGTRTEAAYLRVGDGIVILDGAADPEGFRSPGSAASSPPRRLRGQRRDRPPEPAPPRRTGSPPPR